MPTIWGFPKMVVPNNYLVFLLKMTISGCEMGSTTISGNTHPFSGANLLLVSGRVAEITEFEP